MRPLQVKRHGFCSNSRNRINFASVWLDGAANEFAATSKINGKAPANKRVRAETISSSWGSEGDLLCRNESSATLHRLRADAFFNNGERLNDETETKDQVNTEQHKMP